MDSAGVSRPIHSDDDLRALLLGSIHSAFSLDIRESKIPGAGSGIVTSSDISFGSEIFRTKNALWNVPVNSDIQKTCGNCFSNSASNVSEDGRFCTREQDRPKLLPCGSCKTARYCSRTCQRIAWKDHHKLECQQSHVFQTFTPSGCLLIRILAKVNNRRVSPMQWRALASLKSCLDENLDSPFAAELVGFAERAIGYTGVKIELSKVVNLQCLILTNMMGMRSADQGRDIGATLDLFASQMNHSCDPNAFVFCEGAQLRARSLRPIAAGEEITISYVNPSYDYSFRQKRLKSQYFFACQCEKCRIDVMGQQSVPDHLRSRSPDFDNVQRQLLNFHTNLARSVYEPCRLKDIRDKEDQMGLIGTAGFLSNGWPDYIQPVPEILQSFVLIYMLQGELEQSLRLCLKLCFIIGDSTYGTSSPQWVHLLSLLVQVLAAMVHRPKANPPSRTLSKTKIPLSAIHGACLSQFADAVRGMYGADSAFARAADQLLSTELGMNERRKPMSSNDFVDQFRKEYSALFEWAALG